MGLEGGKAPTGGELAVRKKKSIGVPDSLSLFRSLCALEFEKKEGGSTKWVVRKSGGRGLVYSSTGERKFCKGGTDGGGGRAKGKTTAKRHSWTPLETWPRS